MAKSMSTANMAAIGTLLVAIISGTYHFYSQDRRLTAEETKTLELRQDLDELKNEQSSAYSHINDKLDQVNGNIKTISVSVARLEAYFDVKFNSKDQSI